MKIIAFAGSNSSNSINHQLVSFAATLIDNSEIIQLTDFDIPMYNIDIENIGIPEGVVQLNEKLDEADSFIISVSEHNGNISAFFKNILDWLSRNNGNFLLDKKVVIISTSPGKGGAASALKITEKTLPYFKANIVGTLSVGEFYENFKDRTLVNLEIISNLQSVISKIK